MALFLGSLQLGLIYGLLALGIYITFRVLNLPDLTTDGSFTLGLAVCASLTLAGKPYLGLLCAALAGMAAGCVTGLLQTQLEIHPILSGILTMSGLYTVNLYVLGSRSNLSLIGTDTLFSDLQGLLPALSKDSTKLLAALLVCAALAVFLVWLFKTHLGLCIRAVGDNEEMVRASSIPVAAAKITALALANGSIALSGAVIAQYQGFADISSGIGIVVVGLASVIIGEVFLGRRSVTIGLLSAIAGSILYRLIIALALKSSIFPTYTLKLVSAAIVVVALSIPTMRHKIEQFKRRKAAMQNA
ncbi:MAG: ABC transporter permease [Anaerotruncus sp.]|nr:ABC transporter permease [Anaerotruncus sp.]